MGLSAYGIVGSNSQWRSDMRYIIGGLVILAGLALAAWLGIAVLAGAAIMGIPLLKRLLAWYSRKAA